MSLFEDRQLGHFEVVSQPSEASVYIDGELRDVTPLTVSNMPVGSHTLILRSSAGTVRKTIRIESDHTTSLMEMIYPGWLAVFSEIPLEVRAARRLVGRTGDGRIRMPPGRYEFELTNARFGYRSTRVLQVSPGSGHPAHRQSAERRRRRRRAALGRGLGRGQADRTDAAQVDRRADRRPRDPCHASGAGRAAPLRRRSHSPSRFT